MLLHTASPILTGQIPHGGDVKRAPRIGLGLPRLIAWHAGTVPLSGVPTIAPAVLANSRGIRRPGVFLASRRQHKHPTIPRPAFAHLPTDRIKTRGAVVGSRVGFPICWFAGGVGEVVQQTRLPRGKDQKKTSAGRCRWRWRRGVTVDAGGKKVTEGWWEKS